jgi:RHS repeat-associated protein
VITNYQGNIYKEIYLSAYGEEWVNRGDTLRKITADFTGKPYDNETGFHYFGARYYDSKTSRWISADPAYGDYLNSEKGMGGIYNPVNSQVYHYAFNNPLKYMDPTGEFGIVGMWWRGMGSQETKKLKNPNKNGNHPGSHHGDYHKQTIVSTSKAFSESEIDTAIETWEFEYQQDLSEKLGWGYYEGKSSFCHALSILIINDLNTGVDITFETKVDFLKYLKKKDTGEVIMGYSTAYLTDPVEFVKEYVEYAKQNGYPNAIAAKDIGNGVKEENAARFGIGRSKGHSVIYDRKNKSVTHDPWKGGAGGGRVYEPTFKFEYNKPEENGGE